MTLECDVRRTDSGQSEEVVRTPDTTLESDETRSVNLPLVSSHLLEPRGTVHAVKETQREILILCPLHTPLQDISDPVVDR